MTETTENLISLSPSMVKLMARCAHAGAMKKIKNPLTGKRYLPNYNNDTKSTMAEGIHFEALVNDKPFVPKSEFDQKYNVWFLKHYNGGDKPDDIAERIERYAAFMVDKYELNQGVEKVDYKAPDLEFPEAGFKIAMVIDRIGKVNFGGEKKKLVCDLKWTKDISHVHQVGESAPSEDHMQVLPYSMSYAYEKSNQKELFHQAMRLVMRKVDDGDFMAYAEAEVLINEWAKSTEILDTCYIICESTEMPSEYIDGKNIYYPPHERIQVFNIKPEDYLDCFRYYYMRMKQVRDMIMGNNEYLPHISQMVRADAHKCLGKQSGGARRGKCPFLYGCVYGRRLIDGVHQYEMTGIVEAAISNISNEY